MSIRVAWFSPDPELNKGQSYPLADYFSRQVLPEFSSDVDITVFTNSFSSKVSQQCGCPSYNYLRAFEVHAEKPFDVFFYQIENSRSCYFSRIHMALHPGVTLFHDFILSDFGPEPILNSPWTDVCQNFLKMESGTDTIVWPESDKKYDRTGPLAFREAALTLLPLFSNQNYIGDFQRQIEHKISNLPAQYLPVPALLSEDKANTQTDLVEPVVLYCGATGVENRAHMLLESLKRIVNAPKLVWLIDSFEKVRAQELLQEFELKSVELVEGRTPERWQGLLKQYPSAIAVHTLFSFYSNPSPYLETSMAAGIPCIVSDFGFSDSLPQDVVFKIAVGLDEVREMTALIEKLAKKFSSLYGQFGRRYADAHFSARQIALDLEFIFKNNLASLKAKQQVWQALTQEAHKQVLVEATEWKLKEDALLRRIHEFNPQQGLRVAQADLLFVRTQA
jgi:glycosyltransferase involved in cell wall biosynthesis